MAPIDRPVSVQVGTLSLPGLLSLPAAPVGIVLFAHGSGSGRLSPRNRHVAGVLQAAGIATLLFDLLTPDEDREPERRFDIALLTERLVGATEWIAGQEPLAALPLGYFGASTGAAALERVRCPTLLLVGGRDAPVIPLNEAALSRLAGPKTMRIVPGATHLFEEPGTLEIVAREAERWFSRYLPVAPD